VRREDLREFAARARSPVELAKREHWRAAAQSGAGLAAFEAGQALYEHARESIGFPSEEYLADDLAHHVRLKKLLDRASQAAAFARPAR
jgi:uncharacterized protein YdhG (YjbR/CyaY superfamily)